MPHNIEAEQFLLGAILFDNQTLGRVGSLRPEHFYDPVHARIFEVIKRNIDQGQLADPVVLKAHFASEGTLNELGGEAYLRVLASSVPSLGHDRDYARAIIATAQRRAVIRIAQTLAGEAADEASERDGSALVAWAMAELNVETMGPEAASREIAIGEAMRNALIEGEAEGKTAATNCRVMTGFVHLDRHLGGLRKGRLLVLAARPGVGKSAMAMQIALHVAQAHGPVLVFSLEMTATELAERQLAAQLEIDARDISQGRISSQEFERGWNIAGAHDTMPLSIDEGAQAQFPRIAARIRSAARKSPLALVVIDYLQLIRSEPVKGRTRNDEISEITTSLKALAKEICAPVLLLSQLNRDLEKRGGRRPTLSDLRDSGSIEQDADQVVFLFRSGGAGDNSATTAFIAKNRQGRTGDILFSFAGPTTRFTEIGRLDDGVGD
jgi:replicative DNA helicase